MILRMSLPENALNVPLFDVATVQIGALLTPTKLWTRTEVLGRPCPVPTSAGVYAWFFDSFPKGVPTDGLVCSSGFALLYVGISPRRPSAVGSASRQTIRSRLRYHFQGNAEATHRSSRCDLADARGGWLGSDVWPVKNNRAVTPGAPSASDSPVVSGKPTSRAE